jgi:multidrug transporter EmrE-like cation transporter
LGATDLLIEFSRPIPQIWLSSAVIGVIVIGMWSFNLLSYRGGAQIAIKKLVLNGSYLTMAMVVGILLFGETLTVAKIVGVATYLVAFVLMDDNTWQYFRSWTT